MLTSETFKAGIESLKQNFPDANFTKLKYEVWFEQLGSQLTSEEFEMAIRKAVFEFKQCPTGKEVLNLVKASEKELVADAWAKALEAIFKKLSLNDLDMASQYAIKRLGGAALLEILPINKLQDLRYDFTNHWTSFRKDPDQNFTPPVEIVTPERREFSASEYSDDDVVPRSPEQIAAHQLLKQQLKSIGKGMSLSEKAKKYLPPDIDFALMMQTPNLSEDIYKAQLITEEQDVPF